MPNYEWKQPLPGPEPPGEINLEITPLDDGWREWLQGLRPVAFQNADGSEVESYDVGINVKIELFHSVVWGKKPKPWEKEEVKVTETTKPYRDFTRYRRLYPEAQIGRIQKITVIVIFKIPGRGVWTNEYTFSRALPDHPIFVKSKKRNKYAYRWKQTSGADEEGTIMWENYTIPELWDKEYYFRENDSWTPEPRPPKEILETGLVFPPESDNPLGWSYIQNEGLLLDAAHNEGYEIAWAEKGELDKSTKRPSVQESGPKKEIG